MILIKICIIKGDFTQKKFELKPKYEVAKDIINEIKTIVALRKFR
jgi:hypothetical protein